MQFCRIDKRMAQKWGELSFIPKKKICPIESVMFQSWYQHLFCVCVRTDLC